MKTRRDGKLYLVGIVRFSKSKFRNYDFSSGITDFVSTYFELAESKFQNFVSTTHPSVHDARAFRNPSLYCIMSNNPTRLYPNNMYHILGDSAFPCSTHAIPAIKFALVKNHSENALNYKISTTRVVVEHAFGLLKY